MSERIRYRNVNENQWESIQEFTHATNGACYKILFMKEADAYKYQVVETGSELVAASGLNVNVQQLKKEARAALSSLGVELSRGTRKHKDLGQHVNATSPKFEEKVSSR